MISCRIHVYKSQLRRFQFLNLIMKAIDVHDFNHNKYFSTAMVEKEHFMIAVFDNAINLQFFADADLSVAQKIKSALIENLNAEKFYFKLGEADEEWIELTNYKPTRINRIRYKLLEWLKE